MRYVNAALTLIRGLVRPFALFAIFGGVVGFLAFGMLEEAKFLAAFGGPVVGFWFLERRDTHQSE